ncbi:MAG: 6-phosphogluconolactonase [Actinobacteria bacterium]|nr:6-phosphogluconolactonase [Actinomycetota bacterium]
MNNKSFIFQNKSELGKNAAQQFVRIGTDSIKQNGRFSVALSGGSTPKIMYKELVQNFKDQLDWRNVHFFWSDERYVPLSHPDSNAGMAKRYLLDPLKVETGNIHYVQTNLPDAGRAAMLYEKEILNHFGNSPPRFDLVLLGLGDDGHTASLFPGTQALEERKRLVAANWVEKFQAWRITFTYPLINIAETRVFLVSGKGKAPVVQDILVRKNTRFPAARINPANGNVFWLLDAEAAASI